MPIYSNVRVGEGSIEGAVEDERARERRGWEALSGGGWWLRRRRDGDAGGDAAAAPPRQPTRAG